jgi:glycerol-3-phosphate dehydrogenase
MAVWTYSGVRSLFDDGSTAAQEATRDYVLKLDAPADSPPLLSVFGGKITTYRRLAESALAMLQPYLPNPPGRRTAGWTGREPLPGGGFPMDGFEALFDKTAVRYGFIAKPTLRRLLRAYGTCIDTLIGSATCYTDLGRDFGAGLTEAELRYLIDNEWAQTAEDVVWRRGKLGLRLSAAEIAAIDSAMRRMRAVAPVHAS